MKHRIGVLALAAGLSICMPAIAAPVDDANAAETALGQGDNDTAIRLFTRAIASGQLSADDRESAYAERGKAYLAKGNLAAAISDLRHAVQMKPGDADAQQTLAAALAQRGHGGQAGAAPNTPRPHRPQDAGADANAGMAALNGGRYHQAIDDFTLALDSGGLGQDDSELAYLSRGKAYVQVGDAARAIRDFGAALQINANDQDAQADLGQALLALRARSVVTPIDAATCTTNFSSTGSWLAGKVYRVWASYPTLPPIDAFAGAYAYLSANQWSVTRIDPQGGIISAELPIPGSPRTIGLEVKVDPDGAGSKTSLTETVGGMLITIDLKGTMCSMLAEVPRG